MIQGLTHAIAEILTGASNVHVTIDGVSISLLAFVMIPAIVSLAITILWEVFSK